MAEFPSLAFAQRLAERCNEDAAFQNAAAWSDVNVVFAFGDQRYWLKLYRGEIIDVMEYLPMSNAFGYDVIVSGDLDAWRPVLEGDEQLWDPLSGGRITIDGNLLEANRIHEALCLMAERLQDVEAGAGEVASAAA
jgi:hypothetical protein